MKTALRLLLALVLLVQGMPQPVFAQAGLGCGYNPWIAGMFSQASQARWVDWIERLSGEKPVQVNGKQTLISTRFDRLMAAGDPRAPAYEYVQENAAAFLGKRASISSVPYLMYKPPDNVYNANNLVIDLPGAVHPEQVVVLSAHLDSLSENVNAPAPGADDNASGVAALLEAARLFSQYRFARSLRLIFFTGEEQHEVGSRAYLAEHPPKDVIAAINLDMFAYDRDNDHCIELHAAMLPASQPVAQCYQAQIPAYGLNLKAEVITEAASIESDQSSFWAYGVGSILVMENTTRPNAASLCAGTDSNPYYHTSNDRLEHMNIATGYAAALAGIAAAADLASPLELCRSPQCQLESAPGRVSPAGSFWNALVDHVRRP
jgi:hypothetical protein